MQTSITSYIYWRILSHFFQAMHHDYSSSLSQDDENLDFQAKRVDYEGNDFDSYIDSNPDDSDQIEESRKGVRIKRKNTNKKDQTPQQKKKAIKKNRESAKISRLRKKEFQQALEKTVLERKEEISSHKTSIKQISDQIMAKLAKTNQQKYKFLVEKMNISKKLLTITEDIKKIRQSELSNEKKLEEQNQSNRIEQSHVIESCDLLKSQACGQKEATKSSRLKRKKCDVVAQINKQKMIESLGQKEELLQMSIKAYMYEFGVRGCLRSDVIERSKYEWLQALQQLCPNNYQLEQSVGRMKECFERLESKSKLLDSHLRALKERVKGKYVVQFLLDRQFYINNNADTIYKNSQLKNIGS